MFIDYESPKITLKTALFNGETEDGKKFTIIANWNEWHDWTADSSKIIWDEVQGTEDEAEEIIHEFLRQINS